MRLAWLGLSVGISLLLILAEKKLLLVAPITNSEVALTTFIDNMVVQIAGFTVQRHNYALVDEV